MKCSAAEKKTADWSSSGHLTGHRRCRRSTKHTQKRLLCGGSSEISAASDAKIICIAFTNTSPLRWTPPPPTPPPSFPTCFMSGTAEQMKRCISSRVLVFFGVFISQALRGKWGAKEENWYFKMVLLVCIFLHSCLTLPSLPHDFPPFYLNHTSNNDFWGEDRVRGSTLVHSLPILPFEN